MEREASEGYSLSRKGRVCDKSRYGKKSEQSEGHSRTGEPRAVHKSGHRKKTSKRGTLTNWRAQREGQVRTQKEARIRGTHFLERVERGIS